MKDAEYLFKQTERERKRIGRGDFNKKRQGGKQVRFPSDHLTKKEREALNGECKSYSMEKPVKWAEFRQWPSDLQKNYLLGLEDRFGVRVPHVADMLGVSQKTVYLLTKELGITHSRQHDSGKDLTDWYRFLGMEPLGVEKTETTVEETAEEVEETETPFEKTAVDISAVEVEEPDFAVRLAELLAAFRGTGAKLTIEVVL